MIDQRTQWRHPVSIASYLLAASVVSVATFVAAFRVHGFYIGCGESESPFGDTPPTCFDPLGYNNHLGFRLLLVLGGLVIAFGLVMVGRRLAPGDQTN